MFVSLPPAVNGDIVIGSVAALFSHVMSVSHRGFGRLVALVLDDISGLLSPTHGRNINGLVLKTFKEIKSSKWPHIKAHFQKKNILLRHSVSFSISDHPFVKWKIRFIFVFTANIFTLNSIYYNHKFDLN